MLFKDETYVVPTGVSEEAVMFIRRAHALLAQARHAEPAEKLEYSMQAAFRVAGAVIAQRPAKRRRGSSSAWVRLRAVAPEYAEWAGVFEEFMPLREDVRMGLNFNPDELTVARINSQATQFLAIIEDEMGVLPAVA